MNREAIVRQQPTYAYGCKVDYVVDGDTLDLVIDLGFEVRIVERTRLEGVDTAETHNVSHDSPEYERGQEHTEAVREWVSKRQSGETEEFPFVLYSHEFERGAYGRVVGDIWCPDRKEWLTDFLLRRFDDVERVY